VRIQNETTTPYHQRHPDEPNKEVRKEEKIKNTNNSLNSNHNLGQYTIRWDDNRKGNSFLRESTVQSQHPDLHSENRHKVYRDTANSKQLQVPRNNKLYSYSQYTYTQKQYYQSNSNAKEQKIKNSDFRQRSTNNGNAESRRYQKQTDRNG
jgi:hypothetical protein